MLQIPLDMAQKLVFWTHQSVWWFSSRIQSAQHSPAAQSNLHCSVGPSLCSWKKGSVTSNWQYHSCALTSRVGFTTYLLGGSWCISFYYETSQDLWDLFCSSVLYIACLNTHIVLDILAGYECLTVYLMYGYTWRTWHIIHKVSAV